ncbi:MAG: carboxypeptidase-like regulatory domain-containing protein, partial [Methanomassiliicoccaceae archaeon]|nr:carboxypeptidase-like regulatory domain-containing protein [Methanomassiliicoccaceae archaeon]
FMMNVNDLTPGVTYEVSGTVSSEKEGPLSDVIVTYSILGPDGTPLSSDATTSTDTNGVYSIPNIRFGSTVFINVSKDEYVPAIGTYAMGSVYVDGNKTKDFILINVADLPKYTVSGEVKDEKGNPVTDAEVSYVIVGPTGIETAGTVTTDGSGGFSIENITHGSILTITSIDKGGFGPDAGGLLPSVCVESDQTLTPITIYPSASDSADTCWIWLLLAFILLLCATFFLAFGRKREDEEEEEK